MSTRSISKLTACSIQRRSHFAATLCAIEVSRLTSGHPKWRASVEPVSSSITSIRGAKTKTVIKARDLPQGPLPPLPKDDSDIIQIKTYPVTLQQHLNNMHKFPNCIILTRVGDFYEMYFSQVDEYAPLVGLKKAKRKTSLGPVAMAGFQHWQLERYLKMFLDLGKDVAISEQIKIAKDDRLAKGGTAMYDRKVTRIVTPGTLIDEGFLDPMSSNYLLAVHFEGSPALISAYAAASAVGGRDKRALKVGLSWVDLSSGDFCTQVSDLASLPGLVTRIAPTEVVLSGALEAVARNDIQKLLGDGGYSLHFHRTTSHISSTEEWAPMLERPVVEAEQHFFTPEELAAGNLVLEYVRSKLQDTAIQLQPPVRRSDEEFMAIDKQSLRGLEIRSLLRDGTFKGSLLHTIRRTVTKSGARLLSQRIVSPSMSLSIINKRLDLVEQMLYHDILREDVTALLRKTSDTFRLLQRFSINRGDADDLLGLARTIEVMVEVSEVLHNHAIAIGDTVDGTTIEMGCLWDILNRMNLEGPQKIARAIAAAIDEESLSRQHEREDESREEAADLADEVAAADEAGEKVSTVAKRASKSKPAGASAGSLSDTTDDIWIMLPLASQTLQKAHHILSELLVEKQKLTLDLRKKLNADSLTLQWGPKFGHFCHLKGKDIRNTSSVLTDARSITTTKSTRTFFLPEWTQLGVRIDDAKLRIRAEEQRVFERLRGQVIENLMILRRNAAVLDELDVACSSAIIAKERNLTRPIVHSGNWHKIIGGRHPTVDVGLKEQGRLFTGNDCSVGGKEKIYLITGPNMGGKSTYLRQNALITILAQTGCFVPADYAEIGLVDKIFSRVGSADNLYQDQSTFMVEMLETASILQNASEKSLVIMDEVGRGTTPEDGVAVGFACLHHLHYVNKCRTLFATHFHTLAEMTTDFGGVGCYCTDVEEEGDGSWAYAHKLRRGVNRSSHALKVARLAGLPEEAVRVAEDVVGALRHDSGEESGRGGARNEVELRKMSAAG